MLKDDRKTVKKKELRGRLDSYHSWMVERIQDHTGYSDSELLRKAVSCYYNEMVMLGEVKPLNEISSSVTNDHVVKLVHKIGSVLGNFDDDNQDK